MEETIKILHFEHSFVWCCNWTLLKTDKKYLESFEIWSWKGMEKISWTDLVKKKKRYIESRRRGISYIQ